MSKEKTKVYISVNGGVVSAEKEDGKVLASVNILETLDVISELTPSELDDKVADFLTNNKSFLNLVNTKFQVIGKKVESGSDAQNSATLGAE